MKHAVIRCAGHANVRGSHDRTIEVVAEDSITQAGTCIIGVRAEYSMEEMAALRGSVSIELSCGSIRERVSALVNPLYLPGDPIIIRKSDRVQRRSFAIDANKGAADLSRELIAALAQPGATLEMSIAETGDRSGSGALYVVSVPIGNEEDLTERARRVLRSVDLIACEDTRVSGQLLKEIGSNPQLISYHEHNEAERAAMIVDRILAGDRVAVISDAGTPGLSDPGWRLVSAAVGRGVVVSPVPGASAVLSALVASGMPTDAFVFDGFLPRSQGPRIERIKELSAMGMTAIVYESPHRISETLEDLGGREICVARELTKHNEEFLRGTGASILAELQGTERMRGEFTIVLPPVERVAADADWIEPMARALIAEGVHTRSIAAAIAAATGWPKKKAYALVLSLAD